MSHEPVTGLKTINNIIKLPLSLIYKLTKYRITFELKYDTHWLLSSFSKFFIVRDLELFFSRLRNEDQLLSAEMDELANFPPAFIQKICFERGINIEQSIPE